MVGIKWCLNVKNGLEVIEPNENMSSSYMKMAQESLNMLSKSIDSKIWTASTAYYTMYYSLYSLMMKIGVKCEIHKCSIEFLKHFLFEFYTKEELDLIENGFEIRNNLQYYPNKFINENKFNSVAKGACDFYIKTSQIVSNITSEKIGEIRKKLINQATKKFK